MRIEFLDFRFITVPTKDNLIISINRKKETKFDIVRSHSFTNQSYVGSAISTFAYSTIRNTNTEVNYLHEKKVFNKIFEKRGFSTLAFDRKLKQIKNPEEARPKKNYLGKYSGKITYDSNTSLHKFIFKLLKKSKFPAEDISLPLITGNRKTKNYAFRKKIFLEKLRKKVESE